MKPKKPDSLLERMKKLPLWQWGGICIFSGLLANLTQSLMIQSSKMSRAEERASRMGGAVAVVLFMIVGVVLIILHFVRRKPK